MRYFPAVVAFCSVVPIACGDTAVVVTVRGDIDVPTHLDGVCLSVADSDPGGGEFSRFYRLEGELASLPQTLTVEPGAADSAVATARGYRDGVEVARDRARFTFPGGVGAVDLDLNRCAAGSEREPVRADSVGLAGPLQIAATTGRGGTLIAVVGAGVASVYRAEDSRLIELAVAVPAPPTGPPSDVVTFDADGDCDDDLLVLPSDAAPVLWRREADGSFTDPDALSGTGLFIARAAATADVDGDGDIDIVIGAGAELTLLRNDGTGRFQVDAAAIGAGAAVDVTALAFGDIDADGNADVIVGQGDAVAAPTRVLFNDAAGTGSFERSLGALPELPLRTRSLAVVDANGDQFLDLLVGGVAAPVRLYVNRGDGRLEDRSFVSLPNMDPIDTVAITAADWDGDCAIDVIIGVAGGVTPAIAWRGTDTGAMTVDSFEAPSGTDVLLADADDDGRLDLVVAGGADGLWWGSRR